MKNLDQVKMYARHRMISAIERFIAAKTLEEMTRARQWANAWMWAARLTAPPAGRSNEADRFQGHK
jgi:hypothetical protein